MKVHRDVEQGTPEWDALRRGKVTASCFADVLAKGQGKTRAKYLRRVVAEILTGKTVETFRNADTDRGQELEPMARWAYEIATGHTVERVAFIDHDELRAGCSPDGLIVGQKRGVEIKCVIPTVQVDTLDGGGYPSEHKAQIQGSMWITGYEAWDFCSYSPDMPEKLRTYIHTVERDEPYIQMLQNEVGAFLAEADRMRKRIDLVGLGFEEILQRSLRGGTCSAS